MTFQKYIKYPNMVFLLKKDSNHGKQNDQLFHFPVSVGEEEYKVSLYQLQMELYVGAITPNYPFMRPFKGVITPLITIVGAHLVEHGGKKETPGTSLVGVQTSPNPRYDWIILQN